MSALSSLLCGAASGIINADDPVSMIDEMVGAVRRAADDLKKGDNK